MSRQSRVAVSDHSGARGIEPVHLKAWEGMAGEVMEALATDHLLRRPLPGALDVSLLDDETMARIHLEFMGIRGPTDVITFPYGDLGEILIGVETAARQAREYGRELGQEISLYLIHGILHLAGYDDRSDSEAGEMTRLQEELLTQYGRGMDSIHTGQNRGDSVD